MKDEPPLTLLERARLYPYPFPRKSFTYHDGRTRAFDPDTRVGRIPVLAFGSNQAPVRLWQKYGHLMDQVIPVERGQLDGFDVVFSAHITSYGAIPAMLQAVEAASVELAVTWLTPGQLEIMHETEIAAANYSFAGLEDVSLHLADGSTSDTAYAYIGERGHMTQTGNHPVPLSAIACEGRKVPAKTTAEALSDLYKRCPIAETELDETSFITRLVDDATYRKSISDWLAKDAIPFQARFTRLA